MRPNDVTSLWEALNLRGLGSDRCLWAAGAEVALQDLAGGSSLGGRLEELRGRSVLVTTSDQLTAALTLIEIDGVARRLVLCTPDLPVEHIPYVISTAEVDAVVSDQCPRDVGALGVGCFISCSPTVSPTRDIRRDSQSTEWILFTSGTTGVPKMVVHTLSSLAGAIKSGTPGGPPAVWSTFYDIRRYGGLQILLRAVLGGGSLVLSSAKESTGDFLERARIHAVTHLTGTPSHWRRALMSPAAHLVSPQYVRLSGEIADQAILDRLHVSYPAAKVAHAFASTEAGVAFEVGDGLAGFPADFLNRHGADVQMKVEDDSLRIRSSRTARNYLGREAEPLLDKDGYVDTGDIVELRDGRYHFVGRRGGIINVGGLKIHPEEVEAVINRHPNVRMSLVKSRKNPITGAVVAAEVVLTSPLDDSDATSRAEAVKNEILDACRHALAAHKVPASIRIVPSLEVTPSGKMVRNNA